MFRERENLVSSIILLCKMLEAITPEKVQITVMTQEAVTEKKKRTFEILEMNFMPPPRASHQGCNQEVHKGLIQERSKKKS